MWLYGATPHRGRTRGDVCRGSRSFGAEDEMPLKHDWAALERNQAAFFGFNKMLNNVSAVDCSSSGAW